MLRISDDSYSTVDFLFLFIYSFLPGIYKIAGNQFLMIFSVPIIFYLVLRPSIKIVFRKIDLLFLFYLFYIICLSIVQYLQIHTNRMALFMGIFLDVIPMIGFFYSRKISFEAFVRILIPIGIMHLIVGIILYPLFGINHVLGDVADVLLDGVSAFRMGGVSGSLAFAVLMFMSSISALYYNKKLFVVLLIGVICAAQRSGWLACLWGILFYCFMGIKRRGLSFIGPWIVGAFVFVAVISFATVQMGLDTSYFSSRFEDLGSATSERDEQWTAGIDNFLSMPIGAGSGQVGQVAARYEKSEYSIVPDGDYFRVLSEYGIMGGLFYFALLVMIFITICHANASYSKKRSCLISIIGGTCIQMLGSNITEFFFMNFLYWTFIGFLFIELNNIFVGKQSFITKQIKS